MAGNRCGHQPGDPRLPIKNNPYDQAEWSADSRDELGHQRKSAWFYAVADKLQDIYSYPRMLPALGILYKDLKSRKRRSEAREADCALLIALTHHIELASVNWKDGFCRVGAPSKDGFIYFNNRFWRDKTGLSESRLRRSFARLSTAGFVQRERRWTEREGGKFKGLSTMTLVNHSLYSAIGLIDGLRDAAHFAYQRLQQAAQKLQVGVSRMLSCAVSRAKDQTQRRKKQTAAKAEDYPPSDPRHWESKLNDEQRNAFRNRYLSMLIEHGGGADPASVYRAAYKSVVMS